MYPHDYRPRGGLLLPLLVALAAVGVLLFAFRGSQPAVLSRWAASQALASVPKIIATTIAQPAAPAAIVGMAVPQTLGLEQYNQSSQLVDTAADGAVRHYRRALPGGGTLVYFVAELGPKVQIAVLNADGATPASDAAGDTVWADGRPHLAAVADMVRAPYALRGGQPPVAAIAFGFHGDARTSDEGTVLIDGTLHRVNPGRAALCITRERAARIGLFDAAALRECEQANGAGPVILLGGKVANPAVAAPNDSFVPFNPLGEDFVQLDWRRKIYSGTYPKTAVGIGMRDSAAFVVLATSYGATGLELAGQLKAMGCTDALGGDDDTSTQAVWRGQQVQPGAVQPVPDALAVYVQP
ncbi:MAG TPA: phosphodiester glycosidase family protein [Kouleothrix sp.]|uniref:phosphodiester glycosidase family protein n=1 Tax=Kouleothrix sp. TaxID=2779161 RepID=UPI002BD33235|nr:phosphodiester glycosidase family protein [Kouleothrix sp.]HRC77913.1 phosphodiester glycosidase family protein [Kouleothrix sp.]